MSQLSLTKTYGDLELLFKADIDDMWTELETKTNGGIDSSNLASGWASLGMITLAKDATYTFGASDNGYMMFDTDDNGLYFGNITAAKDIIFKVESAEAARIDSTSNDFKVQKDIYFKDRNTSYSLFRLLGTYQKPVLVYNSSTTINVENNTEVANQSLIVFPTGPIAVTEDVAATNKFRQLSMAATANGYISSHTGAADSGVRVGLVLAANTWYFVYAVRVQYGDDLGNNFILVVDDTSPLFTNHSTLNTRYGTNEWIYLGTIRRGYQDAATTTLLPFVQDHQGWTYFIDRGTADQYLGILGDSQTVSSSTNASCYTMSVGNSGTSTPDTAFAAKFGFRLLADGDNDIGAALDFGLSTSSILYTLPNMECASSSGQIFSFSVKVPIISGAMFSVRRFSSFSDYDFSIRVNIEGILDHYV